MFMYTTSLFKRGTLRTCRRQTRITAVCVLLLAHAGLKAAAEKEKDTVSAAQQVHGLGYCH